MQDNELLGLSVTDAAARIRERQLSPLELTEAYLRRIERLNPRVNAYITVTAERARDDARRATEEIAAGGYRGPLHGIPVALKDLYATRGIRTTAGSKILADWVPEEDGTVVRRLREAGTVLLGKLNTHELAMGATTNNPHYGAAHNPWDLSRVPGGSSGGSSAAIAAGMATATMGSDTGGSIRLPASLCGVVGLMPTYGRVSKAGVTPLSWTYDHAGPLTRTVRDAAIMLQAIAGYDPDDPSTVRAPVDDYTASLEAGVRGLRVGVPRHYFYEQVDGEVRATVEQAVEVLRELGAEVQDVETPDFASSLPVRTIIGTTESRQHYGRYLAERSRDFGADLIARFLQPVPSAEELVRAHRMGDAVTVEMRRILERVDVVVTPTTPVTAPRIDQETVTIAGVEVPVLSALSRFTAPFNQTHLPALSVPCGFTQEGLPVGLQIAGRPFDEALILRVGHAYEQATDWHLRRPSGLD